MGTWENAREGTRGAFACRLEEDPAASPAAPPTQPKAAQAVAEEASAAHYSGLWVGEARPVDEHAYDVPVRRRPRLHALPRRSPSTPASIPNTHACPTPFLHLVRWRPAKAACGRSGPGAGCLL
jgi:hypothetical protein